jgi:transcriptional regulator with XRE-family HTH domain
VLRAEHGLSLDVLAARSGVSRSMISLIERAETSATAVVLEKLATALGVVLASLFDPPSDRPANGPVARKQEQPTWKDPASGYVRRNVSPAGVAQPMHIVDVHFPPGERVRFDTGARDTTVYQQIWVLRGAMTVTVGKDRYALKEGDCLAMTLDRPTSFHNPTRKAARYAVVWASEPAVRR